MTEVKKDLFSKTLSQKSTTMSSDITQYDSFSSQMSVLSTLSSMIKKKQVQCLSKKKLSKEDTVDILKQLRSSLKGHLQGQEEEKEMLNKNVPKIEFSLMQVSDILEAKTSEIDRINELNFIITNKIQEMDFLIEQTKKAIENLKEIDFFQEEERDVFFINSINSKLNNELINSVVTLRNRFGKEVKRQNYNKKTIEKITKEIKQLKFAVYSQTFERKYLNTLNIIDEEDTMEIKDTSLNASIHMNNIKRKSISGMRKSFSIPKLNFTKLKANEDNSLKEEMITSLRSIDNNKKSRNSDTNLYYVNTTSMDNNYSIVHCSHVSISKDDSNIKEK